MQISKAMQQKLANYSTFETRAQSARQRFEELTADKDHKIDPGFVRDYVDARERFRDQTKACDTTEARIAALDGYGVALTALEQHLEKLWVDRLRPETLGCSRSCPGPAT